MTTTSIQWSQLVWNPLRGCSRVSPGCENCYAETIAERFSGPGLHFEGYAERGKGWTRKVSLLGGDKLLDPLHWKAPRKIFVNSMSDLFHEAITNEQIAAIFGVMAACPQHTFQVLTKRAARMRAWFAWMEEARVLGSEPLAECLLGAISPGTTSSRARLAALTVKRPWPLPNVHLGVSVENQHYADERIPDLLHTPAVVRWVSAEPLLDGIELGRYLDSQGWYAQKVWTAPGSAPIPPHHQGSLDWVVVGGESGHHARPFDLVWARALLNQCGRYHVPIFVKQLGAKAFDQLVMDDQRRPLGGVRRLLTDSHGGDMDEWPIDLRVRQWPDDPVARALAARLTAGTGAQHAVRRPNADPRFPGGAP